MSNLQNRQIEQNESPYDRNYFLEKKGLPTPRKFTFPLPKISVPESKQNSSRNGEKMKRNSLAGVDQNFTMAVPKNYVKGNIL